MEIRKLDETYIEHTYHRHTPILMRGKSCTVYDSEGKAYVDLSAGITVNSLGFSDPAWQPTASARLKRCMKRWWQSRKPWAKNSLHCALRGRKKHTRRAS